MGFGCGGGLSEGQNWGFWHYLYTYAVVEALNSLSDSVSYLLLGVNCLIAHFKFISTSLSLYSFILEVNTLLLILTLFMYVRLA